MTNATDYTALAEAVRGRVDELQRLCDAATPGPWYGGYTGPNHRGVTGSTTPCLWQDEKGWFAGDQSDYCRERGENWPWWVVSSEEPYEAEDDDGNECIDYHGRTIAVIPAPGDGIPDKDGMHANAAFIAAARTYLPALLTYARGLLSRYAETEECGASDRQIAYRTELAELADALEVGK